MVPISPNKPPLHLTWVLFQATEKAQNIFLQNTIPFGEWTCSIEYQQDWKAIADNAYRWLWHHHLNQLESFLWVDCIILLLSFFGLAYLSYSQFS